MKLQRFVTMSGFAAALSGAFFFSGGLAAPGDVREIVKGVWFREGDLKQYGHCNNIIIEMKDYLVVVDANFPSGAKLALDMAKKVSKKPVKYVFDTHHHGDHAYGNPVWTKAGAITLAHEGVAAEMKRYEPKRWQEAAKDREDVRSLNLKTAEPPRETFSGDLKVIEDETRRLEFRFFGWAHTRGDGFVYLPKEKVLCTGDAVVNGPFNYMGDGNVKNWPNVVERAMKLDVRHVLPAHGPAGGTEILTGERQFMLEIQKAVAAEIKAGRKLDALVKRDSSKKVLAVNVKLPESVRNWVGDFFPDQVESVYKEITTGKPAGDQQ